MVREGLGRAIIQIPQGVGPGRGLLHQTNFLQRGRKFLPEYDEAGEAYLADARSQPDGNMSLHEGGVQVQEEEKLASKNYKRNFSYNYGTTREKGGKSHDKSGLLNIPK